MKLVLLSGGTGSPKLLQGFMQLLAPEEITVVVNTGEDMWLPYGYFSPDLDTVLYTLAGFVDEERWSGIAGDSFNTHNRLREMGSSEFLAIGDRDRATHILRGELLNNGKSLEEATSAIASAMGIEARVLPMSNDRVETLIVTEDGELNIHEFLALKGGRPEVKDVYHNNIEDALPCDGVIEALENSELIVLGPSNPISSLGPIMSLLGVRHVLSSARERSIAVSPIVGDSPVSGPADKFMRAIGIPPTPEGVASYYRDMIARIVVHFGEDTSSIEKLGIEACRTNIIMRSQRDKRRLAEFILGVGHA